MVQGPVGAQATTVHVPDVPVHVEDEPTAREEKPAEQVHSVAAGVVGPVMLPPAHVDPATHTAHTPADK